MANASLNFEDNSDGTVSMMIRLEGQTDVKSKAHCAVLTLAKEYEKHAERLADPKVTVDPLTEIQEGIAAYEPRIVIAGGFS